MLFPFATAWAEVEVCLAAKAGCSSSGLESTFSLHSAHCHVLLGEEETLFFIKLFLAPCLSA